MSDEVVIFVENLGKKYALRHQRNERYTALRDVLTEKVKGIFRRNGKEDKTREDFWALRDVSFDVKRGEVVGIIGRNGAGKTTLLKILSRITDPTEGRVRIKGRVASLLEVGTGFHPELTGRENIFLNGAILGMGRNEIRVRFDEIVAFAEVERFLDTPVKRYSSGMYVRLAFAVAAHLEPEILVVDEVLAVGDAGFQKKCLSKMDEVSHQQGRTVLFVSHNMTAVVNLCSRAVLLHESRLIIEGQVKEVCNRYAETWRPKPGSRRMGNFLRVLDLVDAAGEAIIAVDEKKPLRFRCVTRVPEPNCLISFIVRDPAGNELFELFDHSFSPSYVPTEETTVFAQTGPLPLRPGSYSVDFWLADRLSQRLEKLDNVLHFDVLASERAQTSLDLQGSLACSAEWSQGSSCLPETSPNE